MGAASVQNTKKRSGKFRHSFMSFSERVRSKKDYSNKKKMATFLLFTWKILALVSKLAGNVILLDVTN